MLFSRKPHKKEDDSVKLKPVTKLSREELLAGISEPSVMKSPKAEDPRFHNPDDILKKGRRDFLPQPHTNGNHQAPVEPAKSEKAPGILKGTNQFPEHIEKKPQQQQQEPVIKAPTDPLDPNMETYAQFREKDMEQKTLLKTMNELRYQHNKEIARWKLYEEQVSQWKDRVLQIVAQLQEDLGKAKTELKETHGLRQKIKSKDEEMRELKQRLLGL